MNILSVFGRCSFRRTKSYVIAERVNGKLVKSTNGWKNYPKNIVFRSMTGRHRFLWRKSKFEKKNPEKRYKKGIKQNEKWKNIIEKKWTIFFTLLLRLSLFGEKIVIFFYLFLVKFGDFCFSVKSAKDEDGWIVGVVNPIDAVFRTRQKFHMNFEIGEHSSFFDYWQNCLRNL